MMAREEVIGKNKKHQNYVVFVSIVCRKAINEWVNAS